MLFMIYYHSFGLVSVFREWLEGFVRGLGSRVGLGV